VKPKAALEKFVQILSPFAPHIAEELWKSWVIKTGCRTKAGLKYNSELIREKEVELAVQVNGKIKDKIVVSADAGEEQIKTGSA